MAKSSNYSFRGWKQDLNAGFALFLLATPLSVGIAIASGAPPSAGLIAAIVGGLLGSWLGGGHVNINGPAAGLIVIILNSVLVLGGGNNEDGFKFTLAAVFVAGLLQIGFGLLKMARIGLSFPLAVVHGVMASIGATIFIKQLHVALGSSTHSKTILGMLGELPNSLMNLNTGSFVVALLTLMSLLVFQGLQSRGQSNLIRQIPAPLIAIIVGVCSSSLMTYFIPGVLNPEASFLHLSSNLFGSFFRPDFSMLLTLDSVKVILTLAIVASLESVLSSFAVDKLDTMNRQTNMDRELVSKGICNCISSWFGGLPIITEIVRSSANISNGAKSNLANFVHSLLILIFALFLPQVLNAIPLASFSAVLIFVGWRLAKPSLFKQMFQIGPDQITTFAVTFLVTITTDLLLGLFAGLVVEFCWSLFLGVKIGDIIGPQFRIQHKDQQVTIKGQSALFFANSFTLRKKLNELLHQSKQITLDLTEAKLIDHTVMEQLNFIGHQVKKMGGQFELKTSELHRSLSDHSLASRRMAHGTLNR